MNALYILFVVEMFAIYVAVCYMEEWYYNGKK